ncbi:MAG: hypothetical protein KDK45_23800 [Leptospiraceae bacterium]|nr:hypothetical protein [Leptospiraceae bacterium]
MFSIELNPVSTKEKIQSYLDKLEEFVEFSSSMKIIGHRFGAHKKYPKNLNRRKLIEQYSETHDLADFAFSFTGLNSLEMDIRLWKDGNVYIVHDKLKKKLPSEARMYMFNNSLEKFIRTFIEKEYYKKHHIYLELKLSGKIFDISNFQFFPDILNPQEKALIERTIDTLESVLAAHPDKENIRKSIHFISFSLSSLHYLYTVSKNEYDTFLIVSTDIFMKKSLSKMFFYFPLTEKEKSRIIFSEWLKGIWFDPKQIKNPMKTFHYINQERKNKLKFFLSSYGMKPEKLFKKLKGSGEKLPIEGVIFECT